MASHMLHTTICAHHHQTVRGRASDLLCPPWLPVRRLRSGQHHDAAFQCGGDRLLQDEYNLRLHQRTLGHDSGDFRDCLLLDRVNQAIRLRWLL
jgi:hypothetical protein